MRLIFLCFALFAAMAHAAGPTVDAKPLPKVDYGLATAKRANCMGCHKWHGGGGPGYGGAAISLRKTQLNREQIVEVIRCGRPGTNMPYFGRQAFKQKPCYEMTFEDFEGEEDNRPLKGKMSLNKRQMNAIADFVEAELQGRELTKAYCLKFFGKPARQCQKIE